MYFPASDSHSLLKLEGRLVKSTPDYLIPDRYFVSKSKLKIFEQSNINIIY
jgi:hypothetical protein